MTVLPGRQKAVNTQTPTQKSTLCIHADTKKTAARAQTGTEETPPATKTGSQSLFFWDDSVHTWPQINLSSFSKLIVYQSAGTQRTHRPQDEPHIGATSCTRHCYSLDFSSLDRCLQRQRLAAQSAWTQPCQDHRDLIQNRFTRGTANWYNVTNNSTEHFGLFWFSGRKKYPKHFTLLYSHI